MDLFQVLFLTGIIGALLIAAIFGIIPFAAFVYVWRRVYPIASNIAIWAAKLENLLSLILITVILFVVIIFGYSYIGTIAILLFIFPVILTIVIELGILVWLIRLLQLLYRNWRAWIISIYYSARLQLIKLRIEIDTLREEGFRNRLNGKNGNNRNGRYGNGPNGRPFNGLNGPRRRLNGINGRPNGINGRPNGPNGRPNSFNSRPNGPNGRPNSFNGPNGPRRSDRLNNGPNGRPNGLNGRPNGINGRPNSRPLDEPNGRQRGPNGRPNGLNRRPNGSNGRPFNGPNGPQRGPNGPNSKPSNGLNNGPKKDTED